MINNSKIPIGSLYFGAKRQSSEDFEETEESSDIDNIVDFKVYDNDDVNKLINCCASGNLSDVIKLYNECKEKILHDSINVHHEILKKCCENGNVEIASWVCDVYDFRFSYNKFMRIACEKNNLHLLKMFYGIGFNIHQNNDELLYLACKHGNLLVAEWLYKMNSKINRECFKISCIAGNLNIVNWIINTRDIALKKNVHKQFDDCLIKIKTAAKTRKDITSIFLTTCINGHLDIAEILYENFKNHIDVGKSNGRIFETICKQKYDKLATIIYNEEFYEEKKIITSSRASKIERRNIDVLMFLCENGDINNVKWFCDFCENMGDAIDITKHGKNCFSKACLNISYDVAKWLYDSNPNYLIDELKKVPVEILSFLNLTQSTIYLLLLCRKNSDNFNIDLVHDIDEIALRALSKYDKISILRKLEIKFGSLTLEINNDGKIIYHLNKNNIKNARNI